MVVRRRAARRRFVRPAGDVGEAECEDGGAAGGIKASAMESFLSQLINGNPVPASVLRRIPGVSMAAPVAPRGGEGGEGSSMRKCVVAAVGPDELREVAVAAVVLGHGALERHEPVAGARGVGGAGVVVVRRERRGCPRRDRGGCRRGSAQVRAQVRSRRHASTRSRATSNSTPPRIS